MRLGNADVAHRQLEKSLPPQSEVNTSVCLAWQRLQCSAKACNNLQYLARRLRRAALACSKLCNELTDKDSPEAETMSRPWLKVEAALALPWPAVCQFGSFTLARTDAFTFLATVTFASASIYHPREVRLPVTSARLGPLNSKLDLGPTMGCSFYHLSRWSAQATVRANPSNAMPAS